MRHHQVKDRHNSNILLCRDGSVAHVDFGILLNMRFAKDMIETTMKLSSEFVQVMGDQFDVFRSLCVEGYLAIRRHWERLMMLLEMSQIAKGSGLPCLEGDACEKLRGRLKLEASEAEAALHMGRVVDAARENVRTDILDAIHGWTHSNVS
uniref:PI3K/PI4K catalytic domain-containing protein n=1 Tax=Hemiselmis andersenii TaxID=464988 RepID=A0A7S0TUI5_HEMAN|mmetsp:Transcript_2442/g.6103  ORF Transcript_2442/g.6103 Transcript_2442/m.6103 type:complete len:151 (+) Transcript_2442:116-568(+)